MKLRSNDGEKEFYTVAPFVGAWIEITNLFCFFVIQAVAPFVGAWIEISVILANTIVFPSLPSWERGLKSLQVDLTGVGVQVAPFVGAWIEIIVPFFRTTK